MYAYLRIAMMLLPIVSLVSCNSSVAASRQQASAADLLDIAFPEQLVVEANVAPFQEALAKRFDETQSFVVRAKADPALRQRFLSDANTVIEKSIRQWLPSLRAQCIKVYEENLTPQEIQDLVAFYKTPTGRKLSRLAIVGSAGSDGETQQEARRDGKNKAVASIGATDGPALEALMRSTAYPKLKITGPKIQEISARYYEQMNDKLVADVELFIHQF